MGAQEAVEQTAALAPPCSQAEPFIMSVFHDMSLRGPCNRVQLLRHHAATQNSSWPVTAHRAHAMHPAAGIITAASTVHGSRQADCWDRQVCRLTRLERR